MNHTWQKTKVWKQSRGLAIFICSLAGTVFGYDLGSLSVAAPGLRHLYAQPVLFGLIVSISLWGTLAFTLVSGWIADRIGRRGLIAICAIIYTFTAISITLPVSDHWEALLLIRFLSGMAVGGLIVAAPLYMAEIADPKQRGNRVALFQVQVGIGVVCAFSIGAILAHRMREVDIWRTCFAAGAILSFCLLVFLHWMPEAPHWMARKGRLKQAKHSAKLLGFTQQECTDIFQIPSTASTTRERLFTHRYLRAILLATCIALFNQLSGVNVLLIYLLDVLTNAGLGIVTSHICTILISCLNVGFTLLGMFIVDRLGRRLLLALGAIGMGACLCTLSIALPLHCNPIFYLAILITYNACFAASQGAVVWVYLSEIFPHGIRETGQAYGASVHWIANAVLIAIYPLLQHWAASKIFFCFGIMMFLQVAVVLLWYPETSGISLGSVFKDAGK